MILCNCSLVSSAEGEGKETFDVECNEQEGHLQLNFLLTAFDPDMESNILAVKYSIRSHHFAVSLIHNFIKLTINTYSILLGTSDCTRNDSVTGLGCSRKADEVTNRVTNTPSGLGYRKALAGIGWANSLPYFLNGLRKCYSLRVPFPGYRVSMHPYR